MSDQTVEYYLSLIANTTDKKRVRKYKRYLEREISDYRLTAYKYPGTNLSRLCNRSANWIEKQLERTLNS